MEGGQDTMPETDSTYLISPNNEEVKGCYNFFCHPRGSGHRFIALILMCSLGFGSYFCYDLPAALQGHITEDLHLSILQCNMLYSVYSWPNVILCFIGGFLIDRVFGIGLGTNLYMGITLIGQIVFALGAYCDIFWLMLCGRFIFGIGGESLAVAQNNYAVLWFTGKHLNMVFGLQLSVARVGSTVNFIVMESIYNWVHQTFIGPQGLGIVFFIATSTCVFSMIGALILGCLDKRAERILRRNEGTTGDVVRLTDIKDFKATFWLITVISLTYSVAIFPFIFLAQRFFIEKFNMSKQAANNISGIVYLISGFASPFIGLFIDKIGKNVTWILVAIIGAVTSHILLAFTFVNPYVAMVTMGLANATLGSSLWPLVSLIIPEYQLGTAYGICQSIQNLGLAVISIVTGLIVHRLGYTAVEIFFICSLTGALICAIYLWVLDRIQKETLNMTPWDRLRQQQSLLVICQPEDRMAAC